MDGFHLPRSALDALPNRAEAYARRGASWTFDAAGVLNLVAALHQSRRQDDQPREVILAPSFDHVLKDPTVDAIRIAPEVEMVILEGNWLLLDEEPWVGISALVDETWFVDVEPAVARDRVARRHLRSGIEETWEGAVRRAEGNDLRNGEEVRRRLVKPGVRVMSVQI
jgi:pantothenate kinase